MYLLSYLSNVWWYLKRNKSITLPWIRIRPKVSDHYGLAEGFPPSLHLKDAAAEQSESYMDQSWMMLQQSRISPIWFRGVCYSRAERIQHGSKLYLVRSSKAEKILHGSESYAPAAQNESYWVQSHMNSTWFNAVSSSRAEWIPHGSELSTAKEQNESRLIYRLCCGRAQFPVAQWIKMAMCCIRAEGIQSDSEPQNKRIPTWLRAVGSSGAGRISIETVFVRAAPRLGPFI
jgi:hypothetical protein